MLGPGWRSRIRLVAATSSSVEVSGCWTTVTLYPSLTRMSSTGFQPEPSRKARCTSTLFLIGAASTGTAVPARTRKAAADTKEFLRLLKIIIRSFALFCSVSCSTNRNGDPNVDGEKCLRVGCISLAAKVTGQCQLHIKQAVLAADLSMKTSSCRQFSKKNSAHDSSRIGRLICLLLMYHF